MSVKSSRGQTIMGGGFRNLTAANEYGGGFKAIGGDTVVEDDGYMVHTFNASGTFKIFSSCGIASLCSIWTITTGPLF